MASEMSTNALTTGSHNASIVQMTIHKLKTTVNIFLNGKFKINLNKL